MITTAQSSIFNLGSATTRCTSRGADDLVDEHLFKGSDISPLALIFWLEVVEKQSKIMAKRCDLTV